MDSEFFTWLSGHQEQYPSRGVPELLQESGGPKGLAIVTVDLVEGFCHQGALASPLISSLVEPIKSFLSESHDLGVRKFLFPCDSHKPDCPEFLSFPAHCIAGTEESKIVSSLLELEFAGTFERFDKRSVSSLVGTKLVESLQEEDIETIVCVGDCTDLCLYHLATGLKFYANHWGLPWRIIVPENLVATYDLPVEQALEIGALPHPSSLMHRLFLYHLELNGIQVCSLSSTSRPT